MSESIQTKQCSKCKQIKSLSEFSKQKFGKYGRRSHCKICQRAYGKQFRQTEHSRIYRKIYEEKYRKADRGKIVKNCLFCGNQYKSYKADNRKYCSRKCMGKAPRTKEWRIKQAEARKTKIGPKASNWKGGRRKHKGYILIYCPNHPFKIMRFYVREHRLVMGKHLGRYLRPEEVVHHINGDKTDNRIENLQLFKNHSEHMCFLNHR